MSGMSSLEKCAVAYGLFLLLISAAWVPLHGWEEAKRRIRVLPLYLLGTTVFAAVFGLMMWFIASAIVPGEPK